MLDPLRTTEINVIDEFLIEDVDVQDLSIGITKKFTSLAITSTIFRWKFGDTPQNPIIETTQNPYYHTFKRTGTYTISHQSCYPCAGSLVCSNGWCVKSINIVPTNYAALAAASIFGFLIFKGVSCEDRGTKEECEELRDYCQWIEKEKKCVKKCKEGYKLKKIKIERKEKLKCR